MRGPVVDCVLFFIRLETRRVHPVGMTPNADSTWMPYQARNLSIYFAERGGIQADAHHHSVPLDP
jgi:hypothetical protein